MSVSPAFRQFLSEAPGVSRPWMQMVQALAESSALDARTEELAYLAVLAATGMESGVPFHAKASAEAGASREEIISAVLCGLPAVGQRVISSLPAAIDAVDGLDE